MSLKVIKKNQSFWKLNQRKLKNWCKVIKILPFRFILTLTYICINCIKVSSSFNYRPEAEKLLPNDSLNILCVMKFKGEDDTTSGTTRPTSISTTVGRR